MFWYLYRLNWEDYYSPRLTKCISHLSLEAMLPARCVDGLNEDARTVRMRLWPYWVLLSGQYGIGKGKRSYIWAHLQGSFVE